MIQRLSQWLLYDVMGYKKNITVERPKKYVIALAPHTSNWDFVIGHLFAWAEGFKCNFMIKKEWFFWPLGYLMRALGGIPIHRSKQMSTTDHLAKVARESDTFRLCVTPEGTRKANPEWKRGFYYIALKADIPVLLYGLDYEKKLIVCTKSLRPTGDFDREMKEVKDYFRVFKGRKPHLFVVD